MNGYGYPRHVRISVGLPEENRRLVAMLSEVMGAQVVKNRNAEWLARALIVAMFALAVWTWPFAPSQIPIHWDITGQINGYGSKLVGLFLLPINCARRATR